MELAAILPAIILMVTVVLTRPLVILVLLYLTTNTLAFFVFDVVAQSETGNGKPVYTGVVQLITVVYWLTLDTVLLVKITPRWEKRLSKTKPVSEVRRYKKCLS